MAEKQNSPGGASQRYETSVKNYQLKDFFCKFEI